MLHKTWNSKEEMPYCFPRSSIKFQGHTGQNITDFDPNWAFPDYRPVAAFKSLRFALFHRHSLYTFYKDDILGMMQVSFWVWALQCRYHSGYGHYIVKPPLIGQARSQNDPIDNTLNVACCLAAMVVTAIPWYLLLHVKSLQFIWTSGTPIWNLGMPQFSNEFLWLNLLNEWVPVIAILAIRLTSPI